MDKEINKIWKILSLSFPEGELITKEELLNNYKDKRFNLRKFYNEDEICAFYMSWDLGSFIYLEYLAVRKEYRSKGFGSLLLKNIKEESSKKIILEAEKLDNPEAKKRLKFYRKNDFCINQYDYKQPPLRESLKSVPMYLISYPDLLSKKQFEEVKKILYRKVYNKYI